MWGPGGIKGLLKSSSLEEVMTQMQTKRAAGGLACLYLVRRAVKMAYLSRSEEQ
jgi:hypothetical protein